MSERDRVALHGLRARGRHGWFDNERRRGQLFVVDVVLWLDAGPAAASDDLADTVDYGALGAAVVALVEGEPVRLLETLAVRIAELVLGDARVAQVAVTVHKPEAPMPVHFDDVSVTVVRERAGEQPPPAGPQAGAPGLRRAAFGLGSNLGDRAESLRSAVAELARVPGLRAVAVSPVYETDPVGGPDHQPPYLNAVLVVETDLPATALLAAAAEVEAAHGRERTVRWGPRTLDIDVLAVGDEVSADPALTLPHPRAHGRAFVLVPWADADPQFVVPGLGAVADLAAAVDRWGVRPRTDVVLSLPEPTTEPPPGPSS